jgi:hypothetical protein
MAAFYANDMPHFKCAAHHTIHQKIALGKNPVHGRLGVFILVRSRSGKSVVWHTSVGHIDGLSLMQKAFPNH